jgi:hypothetical protein
MYKNEIKKTNHLIKKKKTEVNLHSHDPHHETKIAS